MNEEILLRKPGEVGDVREHRVELSLEPFELHGRQHEVGSAEANVSVTKLAEGVHLDVSVRADVRTTCDRTLEDVVLPLRFGDSELVDGSEDEELSVREWKFQVKEYADKALPAEVPMQVFAPGTEPVDSSEDEPEMDPRWKGLEGLLSIAL